MWRITIDWFRLWRWLPSSSLIILVTPFAIATTGRSTEQFLPVVTNVLQFQNSVSQAEWANRPVRLDGVVCWADMTKGMIILEDYSGAAVIEMDPQSQEVQPGQEILLVGTTSRGRGGDSLKIASLTLFNDSVHGMNEQTEELPLQTGKYPVSVSWFDGNNLYGVDILYEGPNLARQSIPESILFHKQLDSEKRTTNWVQGLNYRAYEGQWPQLPDFQQLPVVKTGIVNNFDLGVKTRDTYVGLEFTGYLAIQKDGIYRFSIVPHGRNQLFVEQPQLKRIGDAGMPSPRRITPGQVLSEKERSEWGEAEGVVTFVGHMGFKGSELELSSDNGTMRVEIADNLDGSSSILLGSRTRITGICQGAFTSSGQMLGAVMWVPSLKQVELLEVEPDLWTSHPVRSIMDLLSTNFQSQLEPIVHVSGRIHSVGTNGSMVIQDETGELVLETTQRLPEATGVYVDALGRWSRTKNGIVLQGGGYRKVEQRVQQEVAPLPLLTTAEQVKRLKHEEALRGYPVRIRGVITWSGGGGAVIQDSSMGVFVEMVDSSSSVARKVGEYWEIEGQTTAQFSPMILARRVTRLGLGTLPNPVRPTWDQLMNGTLDTQYVEIQGVVTAIEANTMLLLTHDGKIQVDLPEMQSEALKHYENALIRIRGCLWAAKDEITHMLTVGEVQIHSAIIDLDQAAPANPFAAPSKRASELQLFDAKASAFQQVKVLGQIVHERNGEYFLMDGTNGLRSTVRRTLQLAIGDKVEVVGFPILGGPVPVLREALVHRTGHSHLPEARQLSEDSILDGVYDSTLVKVQAQLVNLSDDPKDQILGLQMGSHIFIGRLDKTFGLIKSVPIGSQLELTGVYLGHGGDRAAGRNIDSFELLLNSPSDIQVLARPSWWTIRRMLAMVGVLLGILFAAVVWISVLHRQVEQRTEQLREEILVRELAEHQRAVEEERTRIARDLHDDLGSSLTEISMLADAGGGSPPVLEKASRRFQSIGFKARELVNVLDVIVWLVNPSKDVLPFLISYLGSYAEEYLSAAGVTCRLKVPSDIPALRITAQVRHNFFMAVKETLNNVVRHARASEVVIETTISEAQLKFIIADNGQGFNPANPMEGNGLLNLQGRLASVGGRCQIISRPHAGTVVTFVLPLPVNPIT